MKQCVQTFFKLCFNFVSTFYQIFIPTPYKLCINVVTKLIQRWYKTDNVLYKVNAKWLQLYQLGINYVSTLYPALQKSWNKVDTNTKCINFVYTLWRLSSWRTNNHNVLRVDLTAVVFQSAPSPRSICFHDLQVMTSPIFNGIIYNTTNAGYTVICEELFKLFIPVLYRAAAWVSQSKEAIYLILQYNMCDAALPINIPRSCIAATVDPDNSVPSFE